MHQTISAIPADTGPRPKTKGFDVGKYRFTLLTSVGVRSWFCAELNITITERLGEGRVEYTAKRDTEHFLRRGALRKFGSAKSAAEAAVKVWA